jgi:hypothetical protein
MDTEDILDLLGYHYFNMISTCGRESPKAELYRCSFVRYPRCCPWVRDQI